ncbi:uncharacterized protein LOC124475986 [Hypomesus transpacificus]|uniref:uncharacterized protein LOC124475986 n=1 Tax=Hypomesus transpacificus TaxID=137520 RepID=UPI001F081921|nr:uncharacterized protein LOC124475986 [Hypomesus transpacificus]
MNSVLNSTFFAGSMEEKSLALDSQGFANGTYKIIGMILAVCLVHAGVGPCIFSERLYSHITSQPAPPEDLAEVDDHDFRSQLQKIKNARSVEEAREWVEEASTFLSMLGALAPIMSLDDRDNLLKSALHYYLNGRLEAVTNQLKEGLEILDVLRTVRTYPDILKSLFVGGGKPLSASEIMNLFSVVYSECGSNKRAVEEVAVGYWRDWLIDVELGEAVIITEDGEENITLSLENV